MKNMVRMPLAVIIAAGLYLPCGYAWREQKEPAVKAEKEENFSAKKFMNVKQVTWMEDTTWFTPEIIEKIEAAYQKWPDNKAVRMYMGRIAGHRKDIETAESFLLKHPFRQARGYLLMTYWEMGEYDKFSAFFDEHPFPHIVLTPWRIELALKQGDWEVVEKNLLLEKNPSKLIKNIIDFGVENNNIQWSYDVLGRLALRTPADEKGATILTQIFAERDKLKVLFPDEIKE